MIDQILKNSTSSILFRNAATEWEKNMTENDLDQRDAQSLDMSEYRDTLVTLSAREVEKIKKDKDLYKILQLLEWWLNPNSSRSLQESHRVWKNFMEVQTSVSKLKNISFTTRISQKTICYQSVSFSTFIGKKQLSRAFGLNSISKTV